jgi:serine protease DegQ
MRKFWLLFSQVVTVVLAVYFVVATLQPQWLGRAPRLAWGSSSPSAGVVPVMEASVPHTADIPAGSFRAAAQKASAAVVSIATATNARANPRSSDPWFRFFFGDQPPQQQSGLGSGVIVSPSGYILTNNHVVEGADEIEITLQDARKANAKVIGTDPETDLALLKIDMPNVPVIVLGNSDSLQVGDQVLAVGNPFGLGHTVSAGIVSALGRNQLGINTFENFIQTDAAINPGNSGGALVDVNGHLLGINTAIYSRSGGSMGIGFAIPVSTARMVMDGLVKDGQVTRGWIGVEPQELTQEMADTFNLKMGQDTLRGIMITGVLQGGPAAKAGIQPGDVITQVAGKPVATVPELLATVAALKPGVSVTFNVRRAAQALQLQVTPAPRPKRPVQQR